MMGMENILEDEQQRNDYMPKRPLKPCQKPGCPNLVERGRYCEEHKAEANKTFRQRTKRDKYYDKYIRDKRAEKFYNSAAWIRTREYVLNKYKYLDLYDYYINKKITRANTVHHIVELKDDWSRRLDINNLFPVSVANHNVIDGLYRKDKKEAQKLLYQLLERWQHEHGP